MTLFQDNKYTRWYYSIIKKHVLFAHGGEVHHIIPKAIGGRDDETNLVRLSFRVHFLVHRLLPLMVKTKNHRIRMNVAIGLMVAHNRYNATARDYEILRKRGIESARKLNSGKKLTKEQKELISKSKKGRPNGLLGKKIPEKTKEKMRLAATGRKMTPEAIEKMRKTKMGTPAWNKGKKASLQARRNMSLAHKGKHKGVLNNQWGKSGGESPNWGRIHSKKARENMRAGWKKRRDKAIRVAYDAGYGFQSDLFEGTPEVIRKVVNK